LCGTTYYYVVEAIDSSGASAPSIQASAATSACAITGGIQINCGGPAINPFIADTDFAGGSTINHVNTINLSNVVNPAPMTVYQTARVGSSTYTISGFNPGSIHTVRLHFAELTWTAAGQRVFNVSSNGTQVLTNFDIFAAAGAMNKAVIQQFTTTANGTGQITLIFTTVTDKALISGIEIH